MNNTAKADQSLLQESSASYCCLYSGRSFMIFYGKSREMATNRLEDQELAVLSLTSCKTAWCTSILVLSRVQEPISLK
ncbi:hypothetical protein FE784_18035 [Paenibacillus hemerocallicola]|uniref:Uncharacterized protein n=1 Tax=Paenibacillus hemerocallicola TaxID=1172614 RepID=A0A5C4T8Q3_9BACL|nr:hypothetical protein FE784_18035 [Paenibacillus hemerocallicola]